MADLCLLPRRMLTNPFPVVLLSAHKKKCQTPSNTVWLFTALHLLVFDPKDIYLFVAFWICEVASGMTLNRCRSLVLPGSRRRRFHPDAILLISLQEAESCGQTHSHTRVQRNILVLLLRRHEASAVLGRCVGMASHV